MRKSTYDKLLAAMVNHNVPEHTRTAIMNDLYGTRGMASVHKRLDDVEASWNALRNTLAYDRRTIASNRYHWVPELRELYEAYLALMDKVRVNIDAAAVQGLTRAQVTRQMCDENRKRKLEGRPLVPACGATWQSWVPASKRQALIDAVEVVYGKMARGKGNRWKPFQSASYRKENVQRLFRLRTSMTDMTKRVAVNPHEDHPVATTYYGALILAALRMAQLELQRRTKGYADGSIDEFVTPIPLYWVHLCDRRMQSRLRMAHADPLSVTPDGLASFYTSDAEVRHLIPTAQVDSAYADLSLDLLGATDEDAPADDTED